MPEEHQTDREVFRAALGPGMSCPPVEELARLFGQSPGGSVPSAVTEHVQSCAYCRTEVGLIQTFVSAETREEDSEAVRFVAEELRVRSAEIFARREAAPPRPGSWWMNLLALPWLRPAAFAAVAVLIAVGIGVEWRFAGPPALRPAGDSGAEVMRSRTLELLAPRGDLTEAPREIQWQPVTGAVRYTVRLLEVDGTELWKTDTMQTRAEIPSQVQARMVPAKTLLCEVGALDSAGRKVAESEAVRFRLLQKVYRQ
jgi:hypothetical protein